MRKREGQKLSEELKKYGYEFSLKREVIKLFLIVAAVLVMGLLFEIRPVCLTALYVLIMSIMPFWLKNYYRRKFEQQKFSDINIYLEQFLYSLQKSKKLLVALNDVYDIFEEGQMKKTLAKAIKYISSTFNDSSVERSGLKIIEEEYDYEMVRTVHRFAMRVENTGGDIASGITLLLDSRRMWADRNYELLKEKQQKRLQIFLSIVTSIGLCYVVYRMASQMGVDISENMLVQGATIVMLFLDVTIYYIADLQLSKMDNDAGESLSLPRYKRYVAYDENKLLGRLGKSMIRGKVTRDLERAFPQWLMQVSLLLQSENVQVAIFKSIGDAPEILKPELESLKEKLVANPNGIKPYMEFLQDFTLPEVRSSMKMLYSLSEGGGGDSSVQIANIIGRNEKMLDKAEKLRAEDSMAGLHGLFLAPQLSAGFKMLIDMIIMLLMYMSSNAAAV